MKPEKYMKLAIIEAEKALEKNEIPIGAILINGETNEILATAYNETQMSKNALAHAEKLCIERAMKKLEKKVLPNTILFSTLEPCPMCASAISLARIKTCYFSTLDKKAGAIISHTQIHKNHPHFFKTKYFFLENELTKKSERLLKNFFIKLRRKYSPF